MKVERKDIARLCRDYGLMLKGLPEGIDGPQLLWSISGNESAFGRMNTPRHEPGYCYISGGRYSRNPRVVELTKGYGCLAHCSLGPWQLMASNAVGFTPLELLMEPEKAIIATIGHLNRAVLPQSKNLRDIADAYNSGNCRDHIVPERYIADLQEHYNVPMEA
jgi:hypothetical protein